MIKNTIYSDRLLSEWKQHGSIIIGLDFDDTIFPYRENFTDINKVINIVKEAIRSNAIVVIYTGSSEDRYSEIQDYCKSIDLKIHSINENIIKPFGDNRKIYANIYLDDRSGLNESIEILTAAMYNYRGYLQNQKPLTEIG
jgi:hypothetical protein